MSDQIHGQMTVQEYIDWIESLEEFAKYMNKPEKGKENDDTQRNQRKD